MPDSNFSLNQTGVSCGQCDLIIVDTESDSIQCDGCDRWYHSWKECSGLKKTLFKLMKKKDLWACRACIELCKNATKNDLIKKLKEELIEVRDLNNIFFLENKNLTQKIFLLEKQLDELKSQINTLELNTDNSNPPIPSESETPTEMLHLSGCNVLNVENVNAFEPNPSFKFSSVHVLADSHGRDIRKKIEHKLTEHKINVSSEIHPGAPMHQYFKSVGQNKLSQKELCLNVVIGGVNDTRREVVDNMISDINDTSEKSTNLLSRPLVIIETPLRYDDVSLNESIVQQNIRLKELCSKFKWYYVSINSALSRMHYTRHGLHLNNKGKEALSSIIADFLAKLKPNFLEILK